MDKLQQNITIKNSIDELPQLAVQIEILSDEWDLPMPIGMNLNLVLEEALTNIIFYAFDDKNEHRITVKIEKNKQKIIVTIIDTGKPFDPTQHTTPDISLSLEERAVGGLGIFLIKKLMDEVTYQRDRNQNILTMIKNI